MRGRHAIGPEIADRVSDAPLEAGRLRAILETIAGQKRVQDACADLGISEQLFERLRDKSMRSASRSLRLKKAGRPAKKLSAGDAEIIRLQQRIVELEAELKAATLRAELAATLPRLAGKKS
jgi:transposase-like protein